MRIRQVKPDFFTDAVVSAWPPAARLFYIGLWTVADDVADSIAEMAAGEVRSIPFVGPARLTHDDPADRP